MSENCLLRQAWEGGGESLHLSEEDLRIFQCRKKLKQKGDPRSVRRPSDYRLLKLFREKGSPIGFGVWIHLM